MSTSRHSPESRSSWAHMPARAMRTSPRRTRVARGQPAAPGAHHRARPTGFADCQRTDTPRRGVTASPCRFDTRAHQISIDRRHFGKTSCMLARGFSREASGPPSPGEPPAFAEDHLAVRKMKALLSKQYVCMYRKAKNSKARTGHRYNEKENANPKLKRLPQGDGHCCLDFRGRSCVQRVGRAARAPCSPCLGGGPSLASVLPKA